MSKRISIEKKAGIKNKKAHFAHSIARNGVRNGVSRNQGKKGTLGLRGALNFNDKRTVAALGMVAMGLAGAATFLLMNSQKKSKKSVHNFYDRYHDLRDNAGEFAHEAYEKGKRAYDAATEYADSLRGSAHEIFEEPHSRALLLAGTVGGTILGASLVYWMHHRGETDRSENFLDKAMHFVDTIKETTQHTAENVRKNDWVKTAREVIESLNEHFHGDEQDSEERGAKPRKQDAIQSAIELGLNGYQFWKNLKRRR